MTPSLIVAELESIGVRVSSPAPDRLKLVAVTGNVPPEAVDLARRHKPAILAALRPVEYKPPIVPDSILADPIVLCPRCRKTRVLAELADMTGGLCFGCFQADAPALVYSHADKPKERSR